MRHLHAPYAHAFLYLYLYLMLPCFSRFASRFDEAFRFDERIWHKNRHENKSMSSFYLYSLIDDTIGYCLACKYVSKVNWILVQGVQQRQVESEDGVDDIRQLIGYKADKKWQKFVEYNA